MGLLKRLFPKIDPKRAANLDDWLKYGSVYSNPGYGLQGRADSTEGPPNDYFTYAERFYKSNATVYAVSKSISSIFSEITFMWRRTNEPNTPFNLFPSKGLDILENPWPGGSAGDLLTRAIQDVHLCGNFYVTREVDETTGNPRLRRLNPAWVDIVLGANAEDAVKSDVIGYAYFPGGVPNENTAQFYDVSEVAHWAPEPDPIAQYRGMSWLQPAVNEILLDKEATRHKQSFFERGARLGVAVTVRDDVPMEKMRQFKEQFISKHVGARNAHEPLFLGPGADVKVIESDLASLDMKAVAASFESRLAAVAGVSASVVGLSEGMPSSTLNGGNLRMATESFIDRTIRPLWRSFCDSIVTVVEVPTTRRGGGAPVRLWYDDRSVSVLNRDRKEDAEIMNTYQTVIAGYVREGYTPDSAVECVQTGDVGKLVHTGRVSVQLYDPTKDPDGDPTSEPGTDFKDTTPKAGKEKDPPKDTGNDPVTPKKEA